MGDATEERHGPNYAVWIIAGIVLLMIGGMAVTIAVSLSAGVSDGFIPPEERQSEPRVAPTGGGRSSR